MTTFSLAHICFLLGTITFLALTSFAVAKMPRLWQNVAFYVAAALCAGGIFYRYALSLSFGNGLHLDTLAMQMMQVCNFNFILVALMLIPCCELARQYSVMFAMFAACTTFISLPGSWANYAWYDCHILNFWLNHVFAVALPLWMIVAKRVKPKKEYALKVTICVVVYFTLSYLISLILKGLEILPAHTNLSYVFSPADNIFLQLLYALIPVPYLYLTPLIPVMYAFFRLLAWLFRKYPLKKNCKQPPLQTQSSQQDNKTYNYKKKD